MRRFIMTIAVAGALLAITAPAAAQQPAAPTQAQLSRAILTPAEVGLGFVTMNTGPRGTELVNYSAEYERFVPREQVGVVLSDGAAVSPFDLALQVLRFNIETGSDQVETVTPPRIGRGAVRFYFTRVRDGVTAYGDIIAWRHGNVTAVVVLTSENADAYVREIALRQQDKLAIAFPLLGG